MSVALPCPSCGARTELRNPGIVLAVCAYCRTALYRHEDVLHMGSRSLPGEPFGALHTGGTGELDHRPVTVVGRARYALADGSARWDEWYVEEADGSAIWLVEDARRLSLERESGAVRLPPGFAPTLGRILEHEGQAWEVEEVGDAVCEGVEGQLPRAVRPGARSRYADLRQVGGPARLTLEYPPGALGGGLPRASFGERVDRGRLRFAPPAHRELRDVAANAVRCSACGAGFELRKQERVRTATCPRCGSQLDLDPAGQKVLSRNPQPVRFPFAVGDRATLRGVEYEVMGRLAWHEGLPEDDEVTREYCLYSEDGGYLWLEEYAGHYTAMRPTDAGPTGAQLRASHRYQRWKVGEHVFAHFEDGVQVLHYVDGALPWLAAVGERVRYTDLVDPPRILSVETGSSERERFAGEYLPAAEVHEAFGRPDGPGPVGVHAAQPSPIGADQRWTAWACAAFVLLNLGLAAAAPMSGRLLHAETIPAHVIEMKPSLVVGPFAVPEGSRNLRIRVSGGLEGRVDGTFLLEPAPGPAESAPRSLWAEQDWSIASLLEPSTQQLLEAPAAGTWALAASLDTTEDIDLRVQVVADARRPGWPLGLAFLLSLVPASAVLRHHAFEAARWRGEDHDAGGLMERLGEMLDEATDLGPGTPGRDD